MRIIDDKRLTLRERQVVALIGLGLRGRAAAERLGVAPFTLRKHRLNILRKLGLTSSAQLSAVAADLVRETLGSDRIARSAGTG